MSEKSINILLVEDNDQDRLLAKKTCGALNIESHMFIVETAEEALSFLKKENNYISAITPDVVMIDLHLPKMSGRDLLNKMKEDLNLSHIPIAILTGTDDNKHIINDYDKNSHRYFQKPSNRDDFITTIREIEKFCLSFMPS